MKKLLKNIHLGTGDTSELENRIDKLINFLDEISNENPDIKVSAGDVFGYICGYMDASADPEDEIEIFE